jgi:hypothetical protein
MDQVTVDGIMGIIENLDLENLALRSLLLPPYGKESRENVESLLETAKSQLEVRERIAARWKKLRDRLQSDQSLTTALNEFARLVPPPKWEN